MPALARSLVDAGLSVTIVTTDDDGLQKHAQVALGTEIQGDCGATYFYFRKNTEFYKFSWPLTCWLWRHISDFDVVHIHALFSYASSAAALIARRNAVPYVIRPLGVLNRWGMQNRRRIVKAISFQLIESRILRGAGAVHYTSRIEQREAEIATSTLGIARSAVIPLPIAPVRGAADPERFFAKFLGARNKQIVLFLSRIHPKKGIELLLDAFHEIHRKHPSAVVVIAGEGEPAYVSVLKRKVDEMKIAEYVIWSGYLSGEEKWAAFAAATVFVLPSFSENFGIAAAEALARGVPAVITEGVGLSEEVQAANAGVVVKPTTHAIAGALDDLLRNADKRREFAANGQQLAIDRFSSEQVGRMLNDLYRQLAVSRTPHC
jgi:glycosyltransferase involved in cell wall biosynthesis